MSTTLTGGLSTDEAVRRVAVDGPNVIPRAEEPAWWRSVVGQLRDAVVLVLLAAGMLTALTGDWADTAVILAVVAVNTTIGAGQEIRAGHAMAALADLTAPRAVVVRDGRPTEIDAREVATGDLLHLAAGDIVAADARLVQAIALQADESMLTGESVPVSKSSGDTVFAGTVVTRGRGAAVVRSVGAASALGKLAGSVLATRAVRTPLQQQLAVLGRRLALAASLAALAVGAFNLLGGRSLETSLVLAISLAVAAIPESLPAVVSLSLALAAKRMASRGVLVRKLAAVEALGSVTVLAMDKTGTLTEGTMTADAFWEEPPGPGAVSLRQAVVLCNDAPLAEARTTADPTEVALLRASEAAGIDVAATWAAWPRVAETPFDPATACMTTMHRSPSGARLAVRKGAPEAVLALLDGDQSGARAAARQLAAQGRRVLAVAAQDGQTDGRWHLLGLAGLSDPPRSTAAATIGAFKTAGVRPVVITGDHPNTARAVAEAVGIADDGDSVHARVRPGDKSGIVARWQSGGEVVAMTGDGVNDAPALRAAAVGVAMGRRGTEVAKQAADLVLADDNLAAMVPAIAEGRRVYDNLKRFLQYGLTGGVAEVLVMLLGPVVGLAVPLRAGQILWMNLLTHGLPGVAMGGEPAAADVLVRPPRSPRAQLLDRQLARRVGLLAVLFAVAALGTGLWALHTGAPAQSHVFLTLTFAQLTLATLLRPAGVHAAANPLLWGSVLLNAVLAVLAVRWQPLLDLLRTAPVDWADIAACLAVGVAVALVSRTQVRGRPRVRHSCDQLGRRAAERPRVR